MTLPPHARPWFIYNDSTPHTRLRLFCLPYAGGSASIFFSWPRAFPPEVTVCPIQLPGRGSRMREKPFTQVRELVLALLPAIQPLLGQPFAFFGHSMGALISYELARELRRRNLPAPKHLFVSAYRAPHLPDPDPPMHNMPEADLIRELTELNGTPSEVLQNQELLQMLLPVLRADTALCETYQHVVEPPLDVRITVLGGLADPKISRAELEEWKSHTTRPCEVRLFPGDHFFLHACPPLLPALRAELVQALDPAQGTPTDSPPAPNPRSP